MLSDITSLPHLKPKIAACAHPFILRLISKLWSRLLKVKAAGKVQCITAEPLVS